MPLLTALPGSGDMLQELPGIPELYTSRTNSARIRQSRPYSGLDLSHFTGTGLGAVGLRGTRALRYRFCYLVQEIWFMSLRSGCSV